MRPIVWVFPVALCLSLYANGAPDVRAVPGLPLRFEPAADGPGHFVARGRHYALDIEPRENTLTWTGKHAAVSLRTSFPNSRAAASVEGVGLLPSRTNYFIGSSPKEWRTDVANFEKIRIRSLYSGVDLVFRGSEGSVEYDFIAQPGADLSAIQFRISGATRMRIEPGGDLLVFHGRESVRWKAPLLYQTIAGTHNPVDGRYQLGPRHTVFFSVGPYDRSRELTIDPVLSYASYLGGSGKELARGIATDSAGNVYVAGGTTSRNFAVTTGAAQTTYEGPSEVFVVKFSPAGSVLYSTFLGGSRIDYAMALAVDSAGNAYVTGDTESSDFPVTANALQRGYGGSGNIGGCQRAGDAFVAKLSPSGSQLLYSTYLGGQSDDIGSAIAVDASGNAYVAGSTLSRNFPVTSGALQTAFRGAGGQLGKPICNGNPWFNSGDGFVAKLNPAGTQLVFSTYMGGGLDDSVLAVAVDSSLNVYVGGFTISPDLPVTSSAYQQTYKGSEGQNQFFRSGDGFIGKLNSAGSSLVYLTYLGGTGDDGVSSLIAAADGSVWASGWSTSRDYPVTSTAVQKNFAGYLNLPFLVEQSTGDAVVAHLDPTGSKLLYGTYFGGAQNEMGTALAVSPAGLVYLAGFSDSPNLPVTSNAVQPKLAGAGGSNLYFTFGDGFLAVIDPNSTTPVYSSYFGGSQDDEFFGIALDPTGGAWLTGNTISGNLPTTAGAAQKAYGGQTDPTVGTYGDAFLVHMTALTIPGPAIGSLQNAASAIVGGVSPGMIFVIYGSNLGPATLAGAALDATGKLSSTIGGVTVTFDGVPAPLVYASAGQTAGVVPYEVANHASTQVVVHNSSQSSAPVAFPVVAAFPGLFAANSAGSGPAAAFNADGTLNSAANPAPKGSIITVYGTGEGQTNPAGVDGQIMLNPLASPVGLCTASVGGQTAGILYCGSVPSVVAGELQVNLQLSATVASGSQPVVVSIGSAQSQPNLTVFVQ